MLNEKELSLKEILVRYPKAYPHLLTEQYPRILQKIEEVWLLQDQAQACFEDLLLNKRKSREGFPHAVYSEIFTLLRLYYQIHPKFEPTSQDTFWKWA